MILRILTSLVMTGAALGMLSCDRDSADAADRPVIALLTPSLSDASVAAMIDGARAHRASLPDDYELLIASVEDDSDPSRQTTLLEKMTIAGADAIVVSPVDPNALVPAVKRARDAGVLVVNIGDRLDPLLVKRSRLEVPFVGPDNRAGARMAGDVLAAELPEGSKIAILEGPQGSFESVERRIGFFNAMKAGGMNIYSVQSAGWKIDRAGKATSSLLRGNRDLRAVLACNDRMALGAAAAIRAAGRDGKVFVAGFGSSPEMEEMIRKGSILVTVDPKRDQLAVLGIETALEMLDGAPREDRNTPLEVVTRESLVP